MYILQAEYCFLPVLPNSCRLDVAREYLVPHVCGCYTQQGVYELAMEQNESPKAKKLEVTMTLKKKAVAPPV